MRNEPSKQLLDRLSPQQKYSLLSREIMQKAPTSMLGFTMYMNPDFRVNWHHRVIARHLDKFVRGDITRLMIFVQPQVGKSELVSRHLPPYILGQDPDHRIIAASYGESFSQEFNLDVQRIMETDRYKSVFPATVIPKDGGERTWVRNSSRIDIVERKGRYHNVGVGGGMTGKTGYTLIIDDPVKGDEEARSAVYRERQWRWFKTVARTRLRKDRQGRPPKILLTMTRWHHDDLAARILSEAKANPHLPQWTVLCFPALREDLLDPLDPRELDEPLWPDMVSKKDCEELKADARTWTALYQQRPSPDKGTIVDRTDWKFYGGKDQNPMPTEFDRIISSWDLTFTEGKSTDYVAGQVWGKKGADKYLLRRFKERIGFNGQIGAIENMRKAYPRMSATLIEKAANGHAAQQTLQNKVSGIILVVPRGSKIIRAEAVSPQVKAGNIYLPDPSICPGILDYIEEWAIFPFGAHDDEVDATSQALSWIEENSLPTDITPIQITGPSKWTRY